MRLTKKILGHRITVFRKMKGLSQEDLAYGMELSRSALARIETGHRTISALELDSIARILGFPLEEFFSTDVGGDAASALNPTGSASSNPAKLRTVLLYLLEHCAGKPNVGETVLYKMLYFLDFNYYERYQEYLTGMKYRKLPYGPVPLFIDQFINGLIEMKDVQRIKCRYQGFLQTRYLPLGRPDMALLVPREKDIIDNVITEFADMSATGISDWSHRDVPWARSIMGLEIDYALALCREPPYSVGRASPEPDSDLNSDLNIE